MSKENKFDVGDVISAKWPGSKTYYPATIVGKTKYRYYVEFKDGSKSTLSLDSVQAPDSPPKRSSRSPARQQSPKKSKKSQSRSRGRQSPSRSRSSSRSRNKKELGSRGDAEINQVNPSKTPPRSPARVRKVIKTAELKMESLPTSIQYLDKMTKVMDEYEPSPSQDVGKVSDVIMPLRASVRIAALQASKAVVEATEVGSNNESKTASVKPVEDEDDDSITLKPSKKYEMGGPIGAFLMSLLLPALCVYVHLACTRYSCTIKQLPVFLKYGSRDPALFYVGWILFQAVLTALPIGKVVEGLPVRCENGFSKLKYRMNGFITLVVNLLMLTSMLYFKCPVSFVYKNLFQLMVISILFSIFMSVALYIKGCRAPSYAQNEAGLSGCPQYDFFQGRELNPRVGKMFDLKLFLIHVGLIGWASVDLCLLYQSYEEFKHLNYPILFTVSCQFVFIFVNLWHADMFLTTAIVNCEGVGYLRVLSMCTLVPFLYSFPVIYLFQYRQEIPLYCLLSTGVVFCCGLYIYLQSNLEKNAFRRNPYSPSVSYLESIPTSKKKRLIVSGLWGTVRHPNYLGDILMNMAWTLPCGFGHFIPFIPALLAVMVLVTRAVREEGKCKQRYGPAWNRYTSQVRYRFIPYIF